MIRVLLKNSQQPELPAVSVEFPITGYEEVYARLEAVGLGHIAISDCCVAEIDGDYPILKRLEKTAVNVDELDYLAKRLESFDSYELAQFQGAAVSCGYFSMRDLISRGRALPCRYLPQHDPGRQGLWNQGYIGLHSDS